MITESKFLQLESLQELMKVQNEEKEMEGLAGSGREDRTVVFASISVRAGPMAAYFLAVVLF